MRLPTFIASTSIALAVMSASFGDVSITAVSDTRSGLISASDGIGGQSDGGFDVTPVVNEFQPIAFNQCVSSGVTQACMNISSSYLGLGPGLLTDGMQGIGTISASKLPGPGSSKASLFHRFGIHVAGVPAGETIPFQWTCSLNDAGANATLKLQGPGLNIVLEGNASSNEIIELGNGTFILNVQGVAPASGIGPMTSSMEFQFELVAIDQVQACGPTAGPCFVAHAGAGCSDTACCTAICLVDPSCCEAQWDTDCAAQATNQCGPAFITGWVPNPLNGHLYSVVTPTSFATANGFAIDHDVNLVSISSLAENEWVRRNLANNIPFYPSFDLRIGLNDQILEGFHQWTSGEPTTYLNWNPGEPNNVGNEDAVELRAFTGRWNDVSAYVVQRSAMEQSWGPCGSGGSCYSEHGPGCNDESCCNETCFKDPYCCNAEWDSFCVDHAEEWCGAATVGAPIPNPVTGSLYYVLSNGSWTQAERIARNLGGRLVTIETAAENEWIRRNVNTVPGSPFLTFIGLNDFVIEGTFQWVSHKPVTFTNWKPGELDDVGESEDVVALQSDGAWVDLANDDAIGAVVEVSCKGDLNGDAEVNAADLAVLLGAWGATDGPADLTGNLIVDAADLAVLLGNWGTCVASNACFGHGFPGSDQPGCTICVCAADPFCCESAWDGLCAVVAANQCNAACQCGE
ncbi:MAG: hypothetical protein JNL80_10935 [Phycisphaerae bacterium]|jgi:hypothetical protein|nr:hypothetical protein [Phycisphaerae bacterium]